MADKDPVGIIGLGVMGSAMSRHILAGGHEVVGFDIDPARRQEFPGTAVQSVADVARHTPIALFSLPSSEALAQVAAEFAESASPGTIAVEMGTLPLADKEAAHALLAPSQVDLLDAPVSGTGLQAADATLVVYSSGDDHAHQRVAPIFDLVGKQTFYLGAFGNGTRIKFVANLLVAVHTLAAAEAHQLGSACGLDPDLVQEVIAAGVGSSAMFEIRGPMMAAGTYDPPSARLAIILKDAGIIADHARSLDTPTPLLDAAVPFYRAAVEAGLGDLDAAALRQLLRDLV
ncbi:MAG: NAD(P)-dependent oxidoreductase [Acidimicrobiia bacterium]|nr:NAD(P)-dependent oxidoreductase [Acidimicrobiia bacterium]MYG60049.1 NAD(P)-dependent oxidoreductase [Acidimicrobiia bacterium]MYJ32217.1 NAD(P)-dependent oxidoreductase [Acidimicrobiia bacterium]